VAGRLAAGLLLALLSPFLAMTLVTIIGSLAALLTTVAYVPQAYQTIRTRDTSALSLPTFLMLFAGTCLWGTYAVLIHDLPILMTNLISGGLATIILYIKLTAKPGDKVARTL
jgi:MtN3 and saliva related transmembrane protein